MHAAARERTHPWRMGAGERWAVAQLSASGEDVVGRVRRPQLLLLARALLLGTQGRPRIPDIVLLPDVLLSRLVPHIVRAACCFHRSGVKTCDCRTQ